MILKIRHDYVTNSSSSSFIISKDDISRGRLLEILLEIANLEAEYAEYGDHYTWEDDVTGSRVAYKYNIHEGTPENPYKFWDSEMEYTNEYIIDNESCVRYDWDAVEEILEKYNIPWHMGYCD